jgi:hypothetical protein
MAFRIYNNNHINIIQTHEKIGEEFCKYYYSVCDTDFNNTISLYSKNPCITFLDQHFIDYQHLLLRIYQHNMFNFTHHEIKGTTQPLGTDGILISVTGILSINKQLTKRFSELFIIKRDDTNNFFIHNHILTLLD